MKKFLAMILATIMILGVFVGCSAKDAATDTQDIPATTTTETTDTKDTASTSAEEMDEANKADTTFGIEPLANPTTIDLAYFSGAEHGLVFYIMDEMGWAEELGISFNWSYFNAGPAMMEASASWDVGTAGAAGAINGVVGYDVNVIGISQYEKLIHMYVRPDSPIYTAGAGNGDAPDNVYGDAESLKGTTWLLPMGPTAQQTLGLYLAYFGLTTDDVTMVNMDVGSALSAFRAGEGDGAVLWTKTDIACSEEGNIAVCGCADVPAVYATCLLASDHAMEEKYDAIVALWDLYFHTEDWMDEHREEMAQYYFDACAVEGIDCSEESAKITADLYVPLGYEGALERMTTLVDDPQGLADRQLTGAEFDVLDTMDFLIACGNYSAQNREDVLSSGRINSSIAEAVAAKN